MHCLLRTRSSSANPLLLDQIPASCFPIIPVEPDDQSDIVAKYVDKSFCLTSLVAGTDFPPPGTAVGSRGRGGCCLFRTRSSPADPPLLNQIPASYFPIIPVEPDDQSDIVAEYVAESFCLSFPCRWCRLHPPRNSSFVSSVTCLIHALIASQGLLLTVPTVSINGDVLFVDID